MSLNLEGLHLGNSSIPFLCSSDNIPFSSPHDLSVLGQSPMKATPTRRYVLCFLKTYKTVEVSVAKQALQNDLILTCALQISRNQDSSSLILWLRFHEGQRSPKLIQVDSTYNVPRYNVLFRYKVLFHLSRILMYTIFVRTFGYKVPFLLSRGVRYMGSRPILWPCLPNRGRGEGAGPEPYTFHLIFQDLKNSHLLHVACHFTSSYEEIKWWGSGDQLINYLLQSTGTFSGQ